MFRCTKAIAALSLSFACASTIAQGYPNIGRVATDKEVAAWDIDVRPDFKGLPKGSGSVTKGMEVWESKCASCHGTFGESNEVFTPIVGGTTKEDVKAGKVAALTDNKQPQRTTLMKVPTVSTLWDYINRAMPWTAPKSLTTEEVYAVTAYILNMAEVLPDDFVLSNENMAEVQKRMPNRNGMTTNHGMWALKGKADVQSVACMKDCKGETKIRSELPDSARNVHGDLSQQNRSFGPVRGVDTSKPPSTEPVGSQVRRDAVANASQQVKVAAPAAKDGAAVAKQNACMACHGLTNKIVGPAFSDIAAKYKGDASAVSRLTERVKNGSSGAWGPVPMPSQAHLKPEDIGTVVKWILAGAK
ncbi:c-type cytochrome [Noviherbaspirillum saxi]|uniref:Cytochrome C n=1 Tax=Noviherbaspirillum saxi TaxID=2320863 RepID=A0A3A3FEK7_9BURK|nr:c-type cytochrome [Noviherbaspirillum saxi]RJF91776.1 cytochrome C [Noviherbaspirillum saxi]